MKILKEITVWNGLEYRPPNHTYLLNSKNQIVAFAKWHGDEIDELKFTDKEDYNVLIAAQKLIDEDIILNKNKPTKLSTGWFSSSIDLNLLKENI